MPGTYYYLIASLPALEVGGDAWITKAQFIYECEKWLSPREMKALYAADLRRGVDDERAGELLQALIDRDLELRKKLAGVRKQKKQKGSPRVPEELKPVMEAKDPLKAETELARLRWHFLDSMQALHFFDLNWLVIYFLKVQILERLASFDKDKGEARFYKLCEVKYEQKNG